MKKNASNPSQDSSAESPLEIDPTVRLISHLSPGPVRVLGALLSSESREVRNILIFGVVFALISLLIPIGAQTVVGLISFGSMTQPLLFLLAVVLFGLLAGAGIRGFQTYLVERWQRRFFVQVAHELVGRVSEGGPLPGHSRYFLEAATVQKAGASLLLDGVMLALQALLGMLLLAFYHPYLLVFDLLLCMAVWGVIRGLGTGAIERCIAHSTQKHKVMDRIDEILAAPVKASGIAQLEESLQSYVEARESYFRVLIRQVLGSLALQAVASVALLGLGAWLVFKNQLTLGQLVASELVVTAVLDSLAKFQKHLEGYYDLVASSAKVDHLLGDTGEWSFLNKKRPGLRTVAHVRPRPVDTRRAKRLVVGLALTVPLLALLPWQQSATGTGRVIAFSPQDRPQEVHAPLDGRISRWNVSEGTVVKAGDVLVELADIDPEILSRLGLERRALERRKTAAQQALATAQINLERQKSLFEQGLSSRRQFEQARVEVTRFEAEEAAAAAEIARIDVRLSRQKSQIVRAPMDGIVLRIAAPGLGQMVKNGQNLLFITPASQSRAVELWIDGNDIPLITEGREVRLQFEGWPALQFSGWPSVAVGTFGGRVQLVDAADNGRGQFRILVVPLDNEAWPAPQFLRQGVRVHAFILLNRVSLGYELWRRFNGFPISVSMDQVESKK